MNIPYEIMLFQYRYQHVREPHFHKDDYEILLCLTDGGTLFIRDRAYPHIHGMVYVIPPGLIHHCIVDTAVSECYIMHFSPDILKQLSSKQTDLLQAYSGKNFFVALEGAELEKVLLLMEQCNSSGKEFGADVVSQAAFVNLIATIAGDLRNNGGAAISPPSKDFRQIEPILNYLHDHYQEDIDLDFLCEKFFVSKSYLCHQFKKVMGFSVGNYLLNYRIRQACALLRDGASVQRACEESGFNNITHFIRKFGEVVGVTPGKYARQLENQMPPETQG